MPSLAVPPYYLNVARNQPSSHSPLHTTNFVVARSAKRRSLPQANSPYFEVHFCVNTKKKPMHRGSVECNRLVLKQLPMRQNAPLT